MIVDSKSAEMSAPDTCTLAEDLVCEGWMGKSKGTLLQPQIFLLLFMLVS